MLTFLHSICSQNSVSLISADSKFFLILCRDLSLKVLSSEAHQSPGTSENSQTVLAAVTFYSEIFQLGLGDSSVGKLLVMQA